MELECLTPEFPQGARIYSVDGVAPSLLNSASAMRSQGFLVCGGGGQHENDQGGGRMSVTQGTSGTLRAQEHGHPPITFDKMGGTEKT